MVIISGNNSDLINLFFYKNKKIALLKIEKKLQQFFYQKNIYVMCQLSDVSIEIFFYKKKSIDEMKDYIQERISINTLKFKEDDFTFLKPLYDLHSANMRRSIHLNKETLWNGAPITQKTDASLYEVKSIQSDQYYSRVKPNYDKNIDLLLSSIEFKETISILIDECLNIPFGYKNLTLKERKSLIYEKDDHWHVLNLYQNYLTLKHEIIIYSEFLNLYHNNDKFLFIEENIDESENVLKFSFIFKDKGENKFKIEYLYKKEIQRKSVKFSSSSEMIFDDIVFTFEKKEISVEKNRNVKKKEADLIGGFLKDMLIEKE